MRLCQCECAQFSLSRLDMVTLTLWGWRQTWLDGKHLFSLQLGLPTLNIYGGLFNGGIDTMQMLLCDTGPTLYKAYTQVSHYHSAAEAYVATG